MSSFKDEIMKIPPVTRFLCASSLAVTIPVMMQLVSPYQIVFVRELVLRRWQIWRVFTSFFLGGSGINFIFDFAMLYRTSSSLESSHYAGRSPDLAWQLLLASGAILGLSTPLSTFVHTRPLLLCLTYLSSALAPPGSQSSLFGVLTIPVAYFPYALVAMDFVMGGPSAAASAVVGCVVGHLWWMLVFSEDGQGRAGTNGLLGGLVRAPAWVRALVSNGAGNAPTPAPTRGQGESVGGGVQVLRPRTTVSSGSGGSSSTGYQWGSGNKLGGS